MYVCVCVCLCRDSSIGCASLVMYESYFPNEFELHFMCVTYSRNVGLKKVVIGKRRISVNASPDVRLPKSQTSFQ